MIRDFLDEVVCQLVLEVSQKSTERGSQMHYNCRIQGIDDDYKGLLGVDNQKVFKTFSTSS
jgi:hypothetical protein